jgi:hypothetical protein
MLSFLYHENVQISQQDFEAQKQLGLMEIRNGGSDNIRDGASKMIKVLASIGMYAIAENDHVTVGLRVNP